MSVRSRTRSVADRFRDAVAGPTGSTLAYTCLCLVTLLFALCLDKMPDQVLDRVRTFFD